MRRPRKFETMVVDDKEMISWGASTSVREMFVHRGKAVGNLDN